MRLARMYVYVCVRVCMCAGADPGGCNRCVCNGQIFLIKNANLC